MAIGWQLSIRRETEGEQIIPKSINEILYTHKMGLNHLTIYVRGPSPLIAMGPHFQVLW